MRSKTQKTQCRVMKSGSRTTEPTGQIGAQGIHVSSVSHLWLWILSTNLKDWFVVTNSQNICSPFREISKQATFLVHSLGFETLTVLFQVIVSCSLSWSLLQYCTLWVGLDSSSCPSPYIPPKKLWTLDLFGNTFRTWALLTTSGFYFK